MKTFCCQKEKELPEGIGLEDGLIRYVDVKKRDNVLVSRIKHEINREPGEQKGLRTLASRFH